LKPSRKAEASSRTLPTSSALDKRLKELADIRINVHRRGRARVYKITVDDHDTSQVREWRWHDISWPDIADHPEMQALDAQKQQKIDGELEAAAEEEQSVDPDEVRRQQKIETAQRIRNTGETIASVAEKIGMSEGWVSNNTEHPE